MIGFGDVKGISFFLIISWGSSRSSEMCSCVTLENNGVELCCNRNVVTHCLPETGNRHRLCPRLLFGAKTAFGLQKKWNSCSDWEKNKNNGISCWKRKLIKVWSQRVLSCMRIKMYFFYTAYILCFLCIKFFIYLAAWVLVVACGIFSCDMWDR